MAGSVYVYVAVSIQAQCKMLHAEGSKVACYRKAAKVWKVNQEK